MNEKEPQLTYIMLRLTLILYQINENMHSPPMKANLPLMSCQWTLYIFHIRERKPLKQIFMFFHPETNVPLL